MKTTRLSLKADFALRLAIVSDFHARSGDMGTDSILPLIGNEKPDLILAPGDIFNNTHEHSVREPYNINGLVLLAGLRAFAPVYYSIGNHEHGISPANRKILEDAGITVLDNEFLHHENLVIGGLTSGYAMDKAHYQSEPVPDLTMLDRFEQAEGYKILLCHHPEYRIRYFAERHIHLTVSGHAHGGQWRIGSRGVYAPGQGLFPKYVAGLHTAETGTLCVSRGMRNTVSIPRFFNPCEVVILDLHR